MKRFIAPIAALFVGSLALGCTTALPESPETPRPLPAPAMPAATAAPACDVVCEGAKVTAVTADPAQVVDAETYTLRETENADAVIGAMRDDFIACYRTRLRAVPSAGGTLLLDVLVGPEGKVLSVGTAGAESLGPARDCIVERVRHGAFDPPHGGGTLNVRVPLILRVGESGEVI